MDPTTKNIEYLINKFKFNDLDDIYKHIEISKLNISDYLKDILLKEGVSNIYDALSIDIADISIRYKLSFMSSEVLDREIFRSFGVLNRLNLKSPAIIIDAETTANIFNAVKSDDEKKMIISSSIKPVIPKINTEEYLSNYMSKDTLYEIGKKYIDHDFINKHIINRFINTGMRYSKMFINHINKNNTTDYVIRCFVDFISQYEMKVVKQKNEWKINGNSFNEFMNIYIHKIFNTSTKKRKLLLGESFCESMKLIDINDIGSYFEILNSWNLNNTFKKNYYDLFDMIKLSDIFPHEAIIKEYNTLSDFLLGFTYFSIKDYVSHYAVNYNVCLLNYMGFYYNKSRWMFNLNQNHSILEYYINSCNKSINPKEEYVKNKIDNIIQQLGQNNNTFVYYFNPHIKMLYSFSVSCIIRNRKLLALLEHFYIDSVYKLFNNRFMIEIKNNGLDQILIKSLNMIGIYYDNDEYEISIDNNSYNNIIHCHLYELYKKTYHAKS